MLNDLYFKTTCSIRPHFLGPMGGLKIDGPLYFSLLPKSTSPMWPQLHDQLSSLIRWGQLYSVAYISGIDLALSAVTGWLRSGPAEHPDSERQ